MIVLIVCCLICACVSIIHVGIDSTIIIILLLHTYIIIIKNAMFLTTHTIIGSRRFSAVTRVGVGNMATPLPQSRVNQLKGFVQLCRADPAVLEQPELSFFKEWLERWVHVHKRV